MKQNILSKFAAPLTIGRKNDFSISMIEYFIDSNPQVVNDLLSTHKLKIKAVNDERVFVLIPA